MGISPASLLFIIIMTFLLLASANLSFLSESGLLQNTVFGSGSQAGLMEISSSAWGTIEATVFGNDIVNRILFFGFWMLIGLVVYILITTFGQMVAETGHQIEAMTYVHARRTLIEGDIVLRLAMRSVAILGLGVWSWIFFKLLLPFSVAASRVFLASLKEPINWFYGSLGLAVLLLSLHVFIILLRLLILRPRLYGGWDRFVA